VTRIEWDGTMRRRMVDTAGRIDGAQWEELAARALAILPLYRPVPRIPIYHVRVDDAVVEAAEHDLTGALLDLITAVLALGEELLPSPPGRRSPAIYPPCEGSPGKVPKLCAASGRGHAGRQERGGLRTGHTRR
jgi:hypothetical protein